MTSKCPRASPGRKAAGEAVPPPRGPRAALWSGPGAAALESGRTVSCSLGPCALRSPLLPPLQAGRVSGCHRRGDRGLKGVQGTFKLGLTNSKNHALYLTQEVLLGGAMETSRCFTLGAPTPQARAGSRR